MLIYVFCLVVSSMANLKSFYPYELASLAFVTFCILFRCCCVLLSVFLK